MTQIIMLYCIHLQTGQTLVFVGAEYIKLMEASKTTALNLLLFWYLPEVNGLYLAYWGCAGAVTMWDCFNAP